MWCWSRTKSLGLGPDCPESLAGHGVMRAAIGKRVSESMRGLGADISCQTIGRSNKRSQAVPKTVLPSCTSPAAPRVRICLHLSLPLSN